MPYKLLLPCLLFSLSAAAAEMPGHFRLECREPRHPTVELRIDKEGAKTYRILYRRGKKEVSRSVGEVVTRKLFDDLSEKGGGLDSWPRERACLPRSAWLVDLDGRKKLVCENSRARAALGDLLSSASLLLSGSRER